MRSSPDADQPDTLILDPTPTSTIAYSPFRESQAYFTYLQPPAAQAARTAKRAPPRAQEFPPPSKNKSPHSEKAFLLPSFLLLLPSRDRGNSPTVSTRAMSERASDEDGPLQQQPIVNYPPTHTSPPNPSAKKPLPSAAAAAAAAAAPVVSTVRTHGTTHLNHPATPHALQPSSDIRLFRNTDCDPPPPPPTPLFSPLCALLLLNGTLVRACPRRVAPMVVGFLVAVCQNLLASPAPLHKQCQRASANEKRVSQNRPACRCTGALRREAYDLR